MPPETRALTRAARERASATGEKYTEAREALQAIRRRMDETGETREQAEAWHAQLAQHHAQLAQHDDDDDEPEYVACDECGAAYSYECNCGWRCDECGGDDSQYGCDCGAEHD